MSLNSTVANVITSGLLITVSIGLSSCAALQPTDANGPRSNLPPYPIAATEPTRIDTAKLAWQQLTQRYGLPQDTSLELEPATATIRSIPANPASSILLPKVGGSSVQTEEETRESLRRFIVDWQSLIGAEPNQLSLTERVDEPSGIRVARYEQRPFRYPLRGGFGNLVIRFQADRRVTDISSTCIANTDRLQTQLAALTPKVSAENAENIVRSPGVSVLSKSGQPGTLTLPASATLEVRQLVAYALPSTNQQNLELRLAWEIEVTNGPIKTIYLDAISEQVIATA